MLDTGSGFWSPIVWVIAIVIAFLVAYILRGFGKKDYKEKTGQTQAFLSGNPEYDKEQMHIKGGNVYWGFLKTFDWIYNVLLKMHNGNVSDYVLWFVIVLAILFILMGVL
jgi:C4-dicarboxylate transporter